MTKQWRKVDYTRKECVQCRMFLVGGEGRRRMSWPEKESHLSHKSLDSEQGVKGHGHVNKLKTDTMRPQFLGLDWDCHLQYPWNVRGMTAEMERGRNASDRLDRKEMPQSPVREHEPQKLKLTHLCCCHWKSKLTLHSKSRHITKFQMHYLLILELRRMFQADLKDIVHTKIKMIFTHLILFQTCMIFWKTRKENPCLCESGPKL